MQGLLVLVIDGRAVAAFDAARNPELENMEGMVRIPVFPSLAAYNHYVEKKKQEEIKQNGISKLSPEEIAALGIVGGDKKEAAFIDLDDIEKAFKKI